MELKLRRNNKKDFRLHLDCLVPSRVHRLVLGGGDGEKFGQVHPKGEHDVGIFREKCRSFFCFWLVFWITAYLWRRVAYLKATFTDDYGFTDRLTRLFLGVLLSSFPLIQEKKQQLQRVKQEKYKDYSIHRRCRIS